MYWALLLELKILSPSEKDSSFYTAETAALKEIGRLDKILSGYDKTSEFSRWQQTSGQAVPISPELFEVRWISSISGGYVAAAPSTLPAEAMHQAMETGGSPTTRSPAGKNWLWQ